MTTAFRLIGACFACVFAAGTGATIVVTLAAMVDGVAHHEYAKAALMIPGAFVIWLMMIVFTAAYSLPGAIVVGVPAHFALRRAGLDLMAAYAGIGALVGLWVALRAPMPFPTYHPSIFSALVAIGAGMAGGAAFHFVMRPR